MKLDKAIELSLEAEQSLRQNKFHDHADAVKICREATLHLRHARQDGAHHAPALLEGETPDGESP